NYLVTALRNMARNKLQSAIAIGGLAVGLCVAIIIGLVIRNEYSYEHFVADYERAYTICIDVILPGRTPDFAPWTPADMAANLKNNITGIDAATRYVFVPESFRKGDIEAREMVYWTDDAFFEIFPFPVLFGDLKKALKQPDGIVLTRSMAQK